jgi:hypothetical protein
MRLMIIGMLTVLIGSTSAFAQQAKPPKPAATQQGGVCANGYERCVKGGVRMGYSHTEAGAFCTRKCGGR